MQELTGANAVIFCPGAVQTGPFVEEIDFTGRHTTSDEELLAMTQLAHDRGMRVFWKPAVNCLDGTWRARISFFDHDVPCETKWSGWFASYQAFQMHFAALAQNEGIANAQPICAGPLRRQVRVPASRHSPCRAP